MTAADLVMVVPSRGRPANVRALREAWRDTATAESHAVIVVDGDDPCREEYIADADDVARVLVAEGPRRRIGPLLNEVAPHYAGMAAAVGFMGDDHRLRTPGWDTAMLAALDQLGDGIVYGNDLIHGEALPTAVVMSSSIVRALGWMVPPGLEHLFLDNAWAELGRALGRLRYLPTVVLEHLHPIAGKAEWDDTYRAANTGEQYARDGAAFEAWRDTQLAADVERVREALGV